MTGPHLARIVESVLGVATVAVFIWIASPEVRPWALIAGSIRRTLQSRRRLLYVAACLLILVVNYLYLALELDSACTEWVKHHNGGRDFTYRIHAIEGDAVARLQAGVKLLPLTFFLGYTYVVVFPCLVFVSIFVFDHLGDRRALAMVLLGYVLNFLIVLPFYLCFPVREAFVYYRDREAKRPAATARAEVGRDGSASGPAARILLDDIHPDVMRAYRTMSGVDNCFPSFHTSLAVTMALVAWRAPRRRYAWLITFFAGANVFSTVYLGVHWLSDVAAGLVVGVLAYGLARGLSGRWRLKEEARPSQRS